MLTIYQIFRNVNRLRVINAQYVKFVKVKKGRTANGDGFIAAQVYTDKLEFRDGTIYSKPDHLKYIAMLVFFDQALHCRVSCSCADFKFRTSYVLNKNDAAEEDYSNGEPPNIRNPKMIPYCCKHITALYLKIAKYLPKEQQPKA
jgi:hypothetical protein